MESYEIAEREYQKLCNAPNVNQDLIKHCHFKEAFMELFYNQIDCRQNCSVTVEGNSVVIECTSNYPEETNGIYKGVSNANRCVLQIEDALGESYLTVKQESACVFGYPEKGMDNLSYGAQIRAYNKYGIEVGIADYHRSEEVIKNANPLRMMYVVDRPGSGSRANPDLSIMNALNGQVVVPSYSDIYNWESYGARRVADGVVEKTKRRNVKNGVNDINRQTEYVTYASLSSEHPERIFGNAGADFAKLEDGHWSTMDGVALSQDDVNRMIQEYNESFLKRPKHL